MEPVFCSASFHDALAEARAAARDQLKAAWQLHVARVEEQLAAGWADHIERVVEERFAALESRIGEEFDKAVESRVAETERAARRRTGERLNQAARRLRLVETEEELVGVLLDAAGGFCERAAVFKVEDGLLRCAGGRGLPEASAAQLAAAAIPFEAAPALANAAQVLDTVVAMRSPRELSPSLTDSFGEDPEQKVFLFAVACRNKAQLVLYADGDHSGVDTGALELLAAVAGAALDARAAGVPGREAGLVTISGAAEPAPARKILPEWTQLPRDEQDLHLRAQRFARVRVAEMRLYKTREVRTGRAVGNLYGELRQEIDAAREAFRLEFVDPCASMVDYLHLEMVRTLANDDDALLGPEYPGPLV